MNRNLLDWQIRINDNRAEATEVVVRRTGKDLVLDYAFPSKPHIQDFLAGLFVR
jgi:hypothetical protein